MRFEDRVGRPADLSREKERLGPSAPAGQDRAPSLTCRSEASPVTVRAQDTGESPFVCGGRHKAPSKNRFQGQQEQHNVSMGVFQPNKVCDLLHRSWQAYYRHHL